MPDPHRSDGPAREAYSARSAKYLAPFDSGWPDHEDDTALVERHLAGLPGPQFLLGSMAQVDSDDGVRAFDHAVTTAYRWPADVFSEHVARTGFEEIQRARRRSPSRPDRSYAAIAASAF